MLKFTKKAMSVVAPVILSAAMVFPVSASEQKISVYLNNVPIVFDTEPSINDGTTYVPMRGIFEALGADVKWNNSEKSITVINNSDTIKLYVGKNDIVINGKKSAKSPYPVISAGRTLVPLRSISELLGAEIDWNPATRRIDISTEDEVKYKSIEGEWVNCAYNRYYGMTITVVKSGDSYNAVISGISPATKLNTKYVTGHNIVKDITGSKGSYKGTSYDNDNKKSVNSSIQVNDNFTEMVINPSTKYQFYDNYFKFRRLSDTDDTVKMQKLADNINVPSPATKSVYFGKERYKTMDELNQIIDDFVTAKFIYQEAVAERDRITSVIKTDKLNADSIRKKLNSPTTPKYQIETYTKQLAELESAIIKNENLLSEQEKIVEKSRIDYDNKEEIYTATKKAVGGEIK